MMSWEHGESLVSESPKEIFFIFSGGADACVPADFSENGVIDIDRDCIGTEQKSNCCHRGVRNLQLNCTKIVKC